jgi:transketolase
MGCVINVETTTVNIASQLVRYGVPFVCDMVQKANSGHPGGPASSFPAAAVLFSKHLRYHPTNPQWVNRDRFVLSAGHESALLYYLLYCIGYLPKTELENFRQIGSKTAGHPEYGVTPGVEVTTGPLSTGFVTGLGIALAERYLHAQLGEALSHYTYVLVSDGDLEEENAKGVAEIAALYKLNKLIVYYDDNNAQIDGRASDVIPTPYAQIFKAWGWHVEIVDGNNLKEIDQAYKNAQKQTTAPTLIVGKNIIGKGIVGLEDNFKSHGAPVGPDAIAKTKQSLGLPTDQNFIDSPEIQNFFKTHNAELLKNVIEPWQKLAKPELFKTLLTKEFKFPTQIDNFANQKEDVATRTVAGRILEQLATLMPQVLVSTADTGSSNCTQMFEKVGGTALKSQMGRYFQMGVREATMGGVANGVGLHSGLVMVTSTYLAFSDFMREFIRLGALMHLPAIYLYTHDSIHVGEDGPTHQPVEHLFALRAIPNLAVYRPADAKETAAVFEHIFTQRLQHGPAVLILTRQNVPVLPFGVEQIKAGVARGGYVLYQSKATPQILLAATGSEVDLVLKVAQNLEAEGVSVRVVSIPCLNLFEQQAEDYRQSVLPDTMPVRLFVEAGCRQGWGWHVGPLGQVCSIDHFGESGKASDLAKKFGFTVEQVLTQAMHLLKESSEKKKKLAQAWGL